MRQQRSEEGRGNNKSCSLVTNVMIQQSTHDTGTAHLIVSIALSKQKIRAKNHTVRFDKLL